MRMETGRTSSFSATHSHNHLVLLTVEGTFLHLQPWGRYQMYPSLMLEEQTDCSLPQVGLSPQTLKVSSDATYRTRSR